MVSTWCWCSALNLQKWAMGENNKHSRRMGLSFLADLPPHPKKQLPFDFPLNKQQWYPQRRPFRRKMKGESIIYNFIVIVATLASLKLGRTWRTFEQNNQPAPEAGSTTRWPAYGCHRFVQGTPKNKWFPFERRHSHMNLHCLCNFCLGYPHSP